MLNLLLGRDQNTLREEALTWAAQPGPDRCLLLVPEQSSHAMERELCRLCGDSSSLYAEVLTFSRLAYRAFQEVGGSARPVLDKGGRVLLMRLAVQKMASQLRVFRRSGMRAPFLSSLLATADECKSCCISPELLLEAGEQGGGDRLKELGWILGAYDALTAERAEDPRDRLTRLADLFHHSDWLEGKRVCLLGFTDFTPQERRVLSAVLDQAQEVTAALRCDTLSLNGEQTFAPTRHTALSLISMANQQRVSMAYRVVPEGTQRPQALQVLERGLFGPETPPMAEAVTEVSLCQAQTPYQELERTAEEILHLVRDEGFRFRDIAVTVRSMGTWEARMETVFGRYGIPIFLSRMDDILCKPVLTLITAAMDAAAGNYEYDDVFRYLKTGLAGVSREDTDLLENYVLCWDIRGSGWTAARGWTGHPNGYGQEWTDQDRALLDRFNDLRKQIIAPLEHLRRSQAKTGSAWARALYAFLEEISLPACLTSRARELVDSGALQQAEEYRQVWQVLVTALEQCSDLLGEDAMTLAEFTELFRLVLSQYQVGSIPVSLDRVTCGDMGRISHSSCRVLFLLGADDASLPKVLSDTGLLTDQDRDLLTRCGAETALNADGRMDREMLLIYQCCTLPTDRLYVSWYARDPDGTEKQPSFLLHSLRDLFPAGLGTYTEYSVPSALPQVLDQASAQGDRAMLGALSVLPGGALARTALGAMDQVREDLSQQSVSDLYGKEIRLSASRMDLVKSCHYAYFLQYGLQARARRRAGLDAPEAGTFVHYVLQKVLSGAEDEGGIALLSPEDVQRRSAEAAETYVTEAMGGLEDKDPRFGYLFRRLADSTVSVVGHMVEELQVSDFRPLAFELGFGRKDGLPPIRMDVNGRQVTVTGIVDRVDGWEQDGDLYLRVMDYKTGKKSFDLTDIWYGLNTQMLLYLFALEQVGLPGDDREIVPAGVLYLPARQTRTTGSRRMGEEQLAKKTDSDLKRSGLVLNDPQVVQAMEHQDGGRMRFLPVTVKKDGELSGEALVSVDQLKDLEGHVQQALRNIAKEIDSGKIQADPWYKSEDNNACRWCEYASACHFEDGRRGEEHRYLTPIRGKAFWAALEEKRRGGDQA